MTEQQFLVAVVNLAKMYGWLAAHHDLSARKVGNVYISNITGDRGSPDLLLVRAPRVILAELKTGTRYARKSRTGLSSAYGLTKEQKVWMAELTKCPGVEAYVWKPDDLEEIATALAR